MKKELQEILDHALEEPPRSRLEPFRQLILQLRRQGRTYRRISQILAEKCGVRTTHSTLYEFVQIRSRPRKGLPELSTEPVTMAPVAARSPTTPEQTASRAYTKLSPEEAAAQREFVRALRNKPVVVPIKDMKPVFIYDPSKPLTNRKT